VRSSPSSSATRSTTVPSGKVVGSSRTSRPFSTRARKPLLCLQYGFPRYAASVNAARRSPSIRGATVRFGSNWRALADCFFKPGRKTGCLSFSTLLSGLYELGTIERERLRPSFVDTSLRCSCQRAPETQRPARHKCLRVSHPFARRCTPGSAAPRPCPVG
jgi:hypothetical protein